MVRFTPRSTLRFWLHGLKMMVKTVFDRREYMRRYREEHKDHINELKRSWYQKNKDKAKEHCRKWYQANREKNLAYQKAWRDARKAATHEHQD